MPLVALIIGTAAIGSEIEDGTAVYLLIKPIKRWVVAFAKVLVAVAATDVPRRPGHDRDRRAHLGHGSGEPPTTFAFAIACAAGGAAYAAAFVALSSLTARALLAGLVYVLIWEGALGGLLEGTRVPVDPAGDARHRRGPGRRPRARPDRRPGSPPS